MAFFYLKLATLLEEPDTDISNCLARCFTVSDHSASFIRSLNVLWRRMALSAGTRDYSYTSASGFLVYSCQFQTTGLDIYGRKRQNLAISKSPLLSLPDWGLEFLNPIPI